MTANSIVRSILLTCACFSLLNSMAANSMAAPPETGKVIGRVVCQSDPGQSYALYIPGKGNKKDWPVIYFFDAHGAGSLPLNKYRSLADEYGFILVGSNNSKNGNDWPTTEKIWRLLQEDTRKRLPINLNRLYTCGFSGGAKAASYIALKFPGIKGVIANGAGLPDGVPAGDLPFSFTAIAGEGDMNMTDLIAINSDLDRYKTRHHLLLFDGKHEWAPGPTMGLAFAGLQFDAMKMGLLPKDGMMIDRYLANSKSRYESYYKEGRLIKAGQECTLSIGFLDGLTDGSAWFKGKLVALGNYALYQKQRREEETLLTEEQGIKADYMQHFQDDLHYWTTTIAGLETKADLGTKGGLETKAGLGTKEGLGTKAEKRSVGARTATAERAMYQRLLAYLSLAFYSFSHQLIQADRNIEARHFVELYKMADPTNSEAWYLSALLNARSNHVRAAEDDLLKAVEEGYTDEGRLIQEPEFKSLAGQIDLLKIRKKMHPVR